MRHSWILEVLSDLRRYALKNGLSELAVNLDQTLKAARSEVSAAEREDDEDPDGPQGGPSGRSRLQ